MNAALLWDAVRDRATADTGAGGLFNVGSPLVTAIYYARVPSSTLMPFLVFFTAAMPEMDAFQKDVTRPIVRISVFVPVIGTSSITDPTARGAAILERLRGDSSAGSAPSYGFHRWLPGTLGSWYAGHFHQRDVLENHTKDVYHWIAEYELVASK